MLSVYVRTTAILVLSLVLQASVLTRARVSDVSIDLMLVLALAAGLSGGPERGAIIGFFSGLLMDLLLQTPFGLSALTYLLVGYLAGAATSLTVRSSRWFPVAVGGLGGAGGVLLFVLLGELVGQPLSSTPGLTRIVVLVGLSCAVLVLPVRAMLSWSMRPPVTGRAVPV